MSSRYTCIPKIKSWGYKSPDSFWSYYDSDLMMMHLRTFTNEEALHFLEVRHAFDQEGDE